MLFGDSVQKTFVLHIPHASTYVPLSNHVADLVPVEIQKMTDWEADKIFEVPEITTIKCDWSRVFCDVERLLNDELRKLGRGFYYTRTDDGKFFRDDILKSYVLENYYLPYHKGFKEIVEAKVQEFGCCRIVDCHTFPDTPFECDSNKTLPRPDICIGTNNVPGYMLKWFWDFFVDKGFEVRLNDPYYGSIVPYDLGVNTEVHSLMIEINRRLYMSEDGTVYKDKVEWLNEMIREVMEFSLL